MSAHDEIRKQLDALMGADRNERKTEKKSFLEPDICKNYLLGCCPYELFTSTKSDRGTCPKLHTAVLKQDYEDYMKNRDDDPFGYEYDLMKTLEQIIYECDRKAERSKQRLQAQEQQNGTTTLLPADDALSNEIKKMIERAEELGEQGKVEESNQLFQKANLLKQQKVAEQASLMVNPLDGQPPQKLRVCDVCASYLSYLDSDRRLTDHFNGKLHAGYVLCRNRLKQYQEKFRDQVKDDDRNRDRDRKRDRERDSRRRESYDRDRERDRDYDRYKNKERYRDRDYYPDERYHHRRK